jgi:putative CocE/NonD family hydrolase
VIRLAHIRAVALVGFVLAASAQAAIVRAYNVPVRMRDGTVLAANVYRPSDAGRVPVVLIRTPYGKNTQSYEAKGKWWAERGYALVVQDARGRGDSDGKFEPFVDDAADGFDTQTLAGSQPWSNG